MMPDTTHAPPETERENEQYASIATISEERKAQARQQPSPPATRNASETVKTADDGETTAPGSPEALEEEAGQQGAFNEETGEINWDCPCLGGMAYGPCGEQFRQAFSCFVFSKEEPKGVDCIEHFKTMQNCFREHPDVYGGELDDDEEGAPAQQEGTDLQGQGQAVSVAKDPAPQQPRAEAEPAEARTLTEPAEAPKNDSPLASGAPVPAKKAEQQRAKAVSEQMKQESPLSESDAVVPRAWHDTRSANEE